jgi:hypothetical protein
MQARTKALNEQLLLLSSDPKELKELGHNRQEIEDLYSSAARVKDLAVGGGLEALVARLE